MKKGAMIQRMEVVRSQAGADLTVPHPLTKTGASSNTPSLPLPRNEWRMLLLARLSIIFTPQVLMGCESS